MISVENFEKKSEKLKKLTVYYELYSSCLFGYIALKYRFMFLQLFLAILLPTC